MKTINPADKRRKAKRRILAKLRALMFVVLHGDFSPSWEGAFVDIITDIRREL